MSDSPMNPHGKFYKGNNGIQAEIGYFSQKNKDGLQDILIKVTGKAAHDEGIDGQVLKCNAARGSNDGIDYQYEQDGNTYTRLSTRKSWGTESLELFVSEETAVLRYDEIASHEVQPLHLLTAYEEGKRKTAEKKK